MTLEWLHLILTFAVGFVAGLYGIRRLVLGESFPELTKSELESWKIIRPKREPMTARELHRELGRSKRRIFVLLRSLQRKGLVEKSGHGYLAAKPSDMVGKIKETTKIIKRDEEGKIIERIRNPAFWYLKAQHVISSDQSK